VGRSLHLGPRADRLRHPLAGQQGRGLHLRRHGGVGDAADPHPDRRRAVNRPHLTCALFGLAFGAVFSAAGFNRYDTIHRLLLLEDAGPFLTMASAVGTGWAITGACPGTASTTLGAGSLMGIVLVAGMITGIALRDLTVREPRPASSPLAESSVQAR